MREFSCHASRLTPHIYPEDRSTLLAFNDRQVHQIRAAAVPEAAVDLEIAAAYHAGVGLTDRASD